MMRNRKRLFLLFALVAMAAGGWILFRSPPRNTSAQGPRPVYAGISANGKQVLFRINHGSVPRPFRYRLNAFTLQTPTGSTRDIPVIDRRVRNLEAGETLAVSPPDGAVCWYLEIEMFEEGTLASWHWSGLTGLKPGTRMTTRPTPTMKLLSPATDADNCFPGM